jgi:uncharacterized membrane protein
MAAERTDHSLERLVFFSDAVFAIAITLLVIEIHPPHITRATGTDAQHLEALANLIPEFIGYIISFFVIGMFWMGHHRAFALAARYSPRVLWWNLLLLCTIAFMPFASAYASANVQQRVPTIFYCTAMLLAALLNLRVNTIATSPPMVSARADPGDADRVRGRGIGVVLGSATAVAVSVVEPRFGQMGLVTIPFWQLIIMKRWSGARASA